VLALSEGGTARVLPWGRNSPTALAFVVAGSARHDGPRARRGFTRRRKVRSSRGMLFRDGNSLSVGLVNQVEVSAGRVQPGSRCG
jgi:hypothetical protein